ILNTIAGDEIVFSYSSSDSVFSENIFTGKTTGHLLKSNYHKKNSRLSDDASLEEIQKFCAENTQYHNIAYNPLKKTFYRVTTIAHNYYTDDGHISLEEKWSLLVADANFNVLGEYVFDMKEYYAAPWLHVIKEGVILEKR